jgi:predicted O-methyltransferase YrrM
MFLLRRLPRLFRSAGSRPLPIQARHVEYSAIASADDDAGRPTDRLLDVALDAVRCARAISMAPIVARMSEPPFYPDIWPGEHYKLLAGLVMSIAPRVVIEVGTFTGLSALAIRQTLPVNARLTTFDIVPWHRFPATCLRPDDFEDGRLVQEIADLGDANAFGRYAALLRSADVIFVDGPKDGRFERLFFDRLARLTLPKRPLLVLDDIRVWSMLALWRRIDRPKLDLTSFGHWSGTGLIDWEDR